MKSLAGTGSLVRLILRRDRILLLVWVLVVGVIPAGISISFAGIVPTAGARQAFVQESASNPVILAFLGPIYDSSLAGLVAWRAGVQGMIFCAIPSLLFIVRHTRAEEEAGRSELLGSTVVGRYAPLTAALAVVVGANAALAALISATLISSGLPIAGSLALGLSWAAAGWIFAAIAAATAQLTETAMTARGIALGIFGLFFVLRVIGDASGLQSAMSWLSWTSPLGWTRLTRPFADERWWVFALVGVLVALVVATAYLLCRRRDLGAGLVAARPGREEAPPALRSPLSLAWRLQRGMLFVWVIAFALFGGALGSIGRSLPELLDSPRTQAFLAEMGSSAPIREALLNLSIYTMSLLVPAYVILAVLWMRSEEAGLRADPVLSNPVSRLQWAGGHLLIAFGGSAAVLAAFGLAMGLIYGLVSGDVRTELPDVLGRALARLPAVWVLGAVAVALYGLLPRFAASGSWGILAVLLLLELGWELRQVSQSVFNISPFAHVHWTLSEISAVSLMGMIGVAVALTIAGVAAFRRRDVQ